MSLAGRTVLVPRGGAWGQRVAGLIEARGGTARVVPLVETVPAADPQLHRALKHLATGGYDWVVTSSAAAAAVLNRRHVQAKVATVGPASASALTDAGVPVDLQPDRDFSATGMLAAWDQAEGTGPGQQILVLRSDLARPELAEGLSQRGGVVEAVTAYDTHALPVSPADRHALASGVVDTVLVTSGSVARALAPLSRSDHTSIACLGPVTAGDARRSGLPVDLTAAQNTIEDLIEALDAALGPDPGTRTVSGANPRPRPGHH